ncbi:MAG TPA: hypothetical protein VGH03_10795 [Caulobacteraceae bacterium]|jgi:hypothetical protein
MRGQPIILLEFNELCPDLLTEWMGEGLLPNFRRFYESSHVFTGEADVAQQEYLEPWIQWYSLHTGFSYDQHGVFHLTDGPRRGLKDIWRLLLDHGYRVGNCAGMNAPGFRSPGSFYLPDPWCNSEEPYPAELAAYQRLVLNKVQENTNPGAALDGRAYFDFAGFWTTHGLSAHSVGGMVQQLFREARDRQESWRRAVLLDKVQFDIFSHYWRQYRPDFASFFINSTAHFQHAYFHLLRPESFDGALGSAEDPAHKDAVLFGYREMDKLLGRFIELEKRGAMLIFATGLSQGPNAGAGLIYYRPRSVEGLLQKLGVAPTRLLPVMAHQYSAEFPDEASVESARETLDRVRYRGATVFDIYSAQQPRTLFFGVGLHGEMPHDAVVELGEPPDRAAGFYQLFYQIPHTKSGAHRPQSALWFKTGAFADGDETVSILDVLPTLLDYYGLEPPEEEAMPRRGASFLPKLGIERYAGLRA